MVDPPIRKAIRKWAEASGCRLCVLFGSRAGTRTGDRADVDLAIDFRDVPNPQRRLTIIGELQAIVDPLPADVTFLHEGTDPVLRFEVFRTGEPLYESSDGLFVKESVRALALFEDALPFRRARRERIHRRAEERRGVL